MIHLRTRERRWLSHDVQSDLYLACDDGVRIPAHIGLLASFSPLMHKLLADNIPCSNCREPITMQVTGFKSGDVREAINLLYTGKTSLVGTDLQGLLSVIATLDLNIDGLNLEGTRANIKDLINDGDSNKASVNKNSNLKRKSTGPHPSRKNAKRSNVRFLDDDNKGQSDAHDAIKRTRLAKKEKDPDEDHYLQADDFESDEPKLSTDVEIVLPGEPLKCDFDITEEYEEMTTEDGPLKKDIKREEQDQAIFECVNCHQEFHFVRSYYNHTQQCQNKVDDNLASIDSRCRICHKEYSLIKTHYILNHFKNGIVKNFLNNDETSRRCPLCLEGGFKTFNQLLLHIGLDHSILSKLLGPSTKKQKSYSEEDSSNTPKAIKTEQGVTKVTKAKATRAAGTPHGTASDHDQEPSVEMSSRRARLKDGPSPTTVEKDRSVKAGQQQGKRRSGVAAGQSPRTIEADVGKTSQEPLRKVNCGTCTKCLLPDCGQCIKCLDKPKFGGKNQLPGGHNNICVKKICRDKKILM